MVDGDRPHACLEDVAKACAAGAEIACGGDRLTRDRSDGFYMAPTVLTGVGSGAEPQEDVLGPVLGAEGFDDAVRIANRMLCVTSEVVFTTSRPRAFEVAERLEAGRLQVTPLGAGACAHLPHVATDASRSGSAECGPQAWDFHTEWRSVCVSC
ncbi:aldehyde dehydrogenase family protein [Streptomyces hydrogenans]|uniref:aldehyde dehydrogenase family protein n=1 Tax=Streptomyces hydrogenans TaxID=1873719 RepID=UPI00332156DD